MCDVCFSEHTAWQLALRGADGFFHHLHSACLGRYGLPDRPVSLATDANQALSVDITVP